MSFHVHRIEEIGLLAPFSLQFASASGCEMLGVVMKRLPLRYPLYVPVFEAESRTVKLIRNAPHEFDEYTFTDTGPATVGVPVMIPLFFVRPAGSDGYGAPAL